MKIYAFVLSVPLIWSSAAIAQQRQQFDLVCQGTSTSKSGVKAEVERAWSDRIRIDLSTRQWCKGTCFYVNSIADISSDELKLNDKIGSVNSAEEILDRRTGTFRFEIGTSLAGGYFERGGGPCRIAPFSGFPARKF